MKTRLIVLFAILLTPVVGVNAQSTQALQIFEAGIKASAVGEHQAALGSFKETLHAIEKEGATDRFFAKVHFNVGVTNYQLGQLDAAIAEYIKAEQFAGGSYERAAYALGLALSEKGQWAGAEKAFRRAIIQNTRNGDAWFDLAFVYVATGERDKAIRAFQNAIKYGAGEPAVSHNNIGVLLAQKAKPEQAEAEFKKAIEISNGTFGAAVTNLERLSGSRGDLALARRKQATEIVRSL